MLRSIINCFPGLHHPWWIFIWYFGFFSNNLLLYLTNYFPTFSSLHAQRLALSFPYQDFLTYPYTSFIQIKYISYQKDINKDGTEIEQVAQNTNP